MENKTAEKAVSKLTKDPEIVKTIVDILSKDLEAIKELLNRKTLTEKG
ncbi:hypothetical protein HDF26_002533 [Pedobacter cryoconitis]|uniref:Uncharacterized protein n=1 Tax=Pedobacter cryoconitis TaxID=188932 RepID=A0A7W9DX63_9SPHI|nr:hypothetical protein [Pedobacter cryoconitis]MBB5634792.1 hypothetical protein [Pedobacter cryoconitis]MBB6272076.1 hypothetical protein [Pedobacter cryoconitis]